MTRSSDRVTVTPSDPYRFQLRGETGWNRMLQLPSLGSPSLVFGKFHSEYLLFSDGKTINSFPVSKEAGRGMETLSPARMVLHGWSEIEEYFQECWRVLLLPPLLRFYT